MPDCKKLDPFVTPYVVNNFAVGGLLIGTKTNLYVSTDGGDNLQSILPVSSVVTALSYGGRADGNYLNDQIWVASGNGLQYRVNNGDAFTTVTPANYGGAAIRDLVADRENWRRLYIVDANSQVWFTGDAGATPFANLTANVKSLSGDLRTIDLVYTGAGAQA